MEDLKREVCEMILERLGFDDLTVNDVDFQAPLFAAQDKEGIGLGLDSVDTLEIVAGIRQNYSIRITENDMHIFKNIDTIVDFVDQKLSSNAS
ncbi:acyl carrier protein [Alkaliphilus pronyensis]|uniref:Acyl carrier protein n=1 Tax=Alkaliphilus pronyensis TaxID=1482732 RepID=A0A6I0F3H8_9FIRM|nr:phosphopantetheine-binding protein [Alkaliphilus pronyensis]KAB3533465.1 acyl carrier protein [Alkaliphilus pronyensis]